MKAAAIFRRIAQEGPTTRCGSCGQLFFRSSMTLFSNRRHEFLHALPDLQNVLQYMLRLLPDSDERLICSSCNSTISSNRCPKFSFGQVLPHPPIPNIVSELSDLEASLCSPQLAFAQITDMQWQKQEKLKGAVVNVPTNYKTTTQQLPTPDIKDYRIQVDLKRRLEYKRNFKTGLVRPYHVRHAWAVLCKTPLYEEADIRYVDTLENYFDEVPHQDDCESRDEECDASEDDHGSQEHKDLEMSEINDFDVRSMDDLGFVIKDETRNSSETVSDAICAENGNNGTQDLVQSHKTNTGIDMVLDDEDLYEAEDAVDETIPTTITFLDIETVANDLRQSCMRIAPAEGNRPQGLLRSKNGEELCFPKLFAGHEQQGYGDTPYYLVARHELRSADRRFASDPQNIVFKMRKSHCQTVCGIANMSVRRAHRGTITAAQLLNPIDRDDLCNHDLSYMSLKALKTSPDHKTEIKNDIFAMIKQLGKPCWFIILTCGNSLWPEMTKILYSLKHGQDPSDEILDGMNSIDKDKLVAEDSVTSARYFHKRTSKFIREVLLKTKILGEIIDYAGVDEFTSMGNPHVHLLVWTEDAPIFDVNSDEQVISYIDRYLTTDIDSVDPELGNVQRHIHKRRCGGRFRACSFGFPLPPMPETKILRALDEIDKCDEALQQHQRNYSIILNELRSVNLAMKEATGMPCR